MLNKECSRAFQYPSFYLFFNQKTRRRPMPLLPQPHLSQQARALPTMKTRDLSLMRSAQLKLGIPPCLCSIATVRQRRRRARFQALAPSDGAQQRASNENRTTNTKRHALVATTTHQSASAAPQAARRQEGPHEAPNTCAQRQDQLQRHIVPEARAQMRKACVFLQTREAPRQTVQSRRSSCQSFSICQA